MRRHKHSKTPKIIAALTILAVLPLFSSSFYHSDTFSAAIEPEAEKTMLYYFNSTELSQSAKESPAAVLTTSDAPVHTESEELTTPAIEMLQEDPVWWTDEDVALLAAVISAESRGEPYEGQLAVGCVILNRLESGIWGDTMQDVLYAPNQFANPYWQYGESEEQAALACLSGERMFPAGVIFFQEKKLDVWFGATWYTSIGGHNFYEKEDLC